MPGSESWQTRGRRDRKPAGRRSRLPQALWPARGWRGLESCRFVSVCRGALPTGRGPHRGQSASLGSAAGDCQQLCLGEQDCAGRPGSRAGTAEAGNRRSPTLAAELRAEMHASLEGCPVVNPREEHNCGLAAAGHMPCRSSWEHLLPLLNIAIFLDRCEGQSSCYPK